MAEKKGCARSYDDEHGYNPGRKRTDESIDLTKADVVAIHSLINHSALLEKDLPGSNGCAYISHNDKKQVRGKTFRKIRMVKPFQNLSPRWST